MPRTHESWLCPTCHSRKTTAPVREAFCTNDDCTHGMVPWREDYTDAVLAHVELTPAQRGIDHLMRTNGDLRT